jgi:uncharacterized integral membrane protein
MTASTDTTAAERNPTGGKPDRKARARLLAAAILGGVLVLFAALNNQTVRVHWLFATTDLPLVVVIVLAGLLGFALGWLVARRRAAAKAAS